MKKLLALLVFIGALSPCFATDTKCPGDPDCPCDGKDIPEEVQEEA